MTWLPVCMGDGRSNATTATSALAVGARNISLASASAYTAGLPVFVSESNDTEVEYVGTIDSKSGSTIRVSHGIIAAKLINAKVWQPTRYVVFGSPPSGETRIEDDRGVDFVRTMDGVPHGIRVRDAISDVVWEHLQIDIDVLKNIRDYLTNSSGVDSGMEQFAVSYYDRESKTRVCKKVRMTGPVPNFVESPANMGSLSLRLHIIGDGYD